MEELLDQLEMIFRARGLTSAHGRIFGALLLAKNPLTQKEIAKLTNYSIPAVSLGLDDLLKLGLVKSKKLTGKREKVYLITGDLVRMFKNFLRNLKEKNVAPLLETIKVMKTINRTSGILKLEKEIERLNNYLDALLKVQIGE